MLWRDDHTCLIICVGEEWDKIRGNGALDRFNRKKNERKWEGQYL